LMLRIECLFVCVLCALSLLCTRPLFFRFVILF
jgi:hypothetical protein